MYLLFVDESGTHGGSHAFVLGGIAVHENDAQKLQLELDKIVVDNLQRVPPNSDEYELHASEMRNAKKPTPRSLTRKQSVWSTVDRQIRHRILDASYQLIADFNPSDARQPLSIFGVVIDSRFHGSETQLTSKFHRIDR